MEHNPADIAANFEKIRRRMRRAEKAYDRAENAAALVAVSKNREVEALSAALATGQRLFGENRVQEAQAHWAQARATYPDLRLHLIGPLQTNKIEEAVALFDCIETLDREKLALGLKNSLNASARTKDFFIQVNTGEESQKAGIAPRDVAAFLHFCVRECGLGVSGLMCIPPADEPAGLHFALLKKLAQENGLKNLSMGMSADFEKGIALGATHVRVGTAFFT